MASDTANYYNNNAQLFAESTFTVDMSALYSQFLPHIKSSGCILDAGCGSGRDALHFKQQGFTVDAFDASPELAKIASKHLHQPVDVSTFQTFNKQQKYDGIWCCASLLHVPRLELPQAFLNLQHALKPNGVLYVSFKYGTQERIHNGREFTDLNEVGLTALITHHTELKILKQWQSVDQRPGRENEVWLNALIKAVPVL